MNILISHHGFSGDRQTFERMRSAILPHLSSQSPSALRRFLQADPSTTWATSPSEAREMGRELDAVLTVLDEPPWLIDAVRALAKACRAASLYGEFLVGNPCTGALREEQRVSDVRLSTPTPHTGHAPVEPAWATRDRGPGGSW